MAKKIKLTQGKEAIVDDDLYEYLSQWKWSVVAGKNTVYAVRSKKQQGRRIGILMHRMIVDAPKGMSVDHIDGNGLNNTRSNLRVCTNAQNHFNQGLNKNSVSGFKGVRPARKKYRARIYFDYKEVDLGYFDTPEEAARAYDEKAKELFGEFARTNF